MVAKRRIVMNENELTPEERTAFEALPREREPSRLVEERTVAELRERGLLRRARGSGASRILRATAAAAAIAVFVGGFAAGRATAPDGRVLDRGDAMGGAPDSAANEPPARETDEPTRIVWL